MRQTAGAPMPVVRFLPANVEVPVPTNSRLVDITDEHPEAEVPYSCRSASCGTCRVKVEEGMEAFPPADDDEKSVLEIFGDEPKVRLCCQLKLVNDVPKVVLRVVDP